VFDISGIFNEIRINLANYYSLVYCFNYLHPLIFFNANLFEKKLVKHTDFVYLWSLEIARIAICEPHYYAGNVPAGNVTGDDSIFTDGLQG